MFNFSRFVSAVAAWLLCSCVVSAQTGLALPDEDALNRLGLTTAWWGQAEIDARRDHLDYISVDDQNVYVQSSSGIVTAFNGETGRRLWTQLAGTPGRRGFQLATNDDQVLLASGMYLYSLSKETGKIRWELRLPDHPSATPAMDSKQIYVGTVDGMVFSYNLQKVEELYRAAMLPQWGIKARLWRFKTPTEVVSPPIPMGKNVMFASQTGVIYGVTKKDRLLNFELETSGKINAPVGYTKDLGLVGDSQSQLYCINQSNGHVRWTYSSGTPIHQQPRVVGNQVFIVPHHQGLAALALQSGTQQWQQDRANNMIAVSETRVYASDNLNNLLILDRQTGQVLGVLQLRQLPARVNNDRTDRIYLSSDSGTVVSLREIGSDYPIYHMNPDERPILPEFAPDEEPSKPESTKA